MPRTRTTGLPPVARERLLAQLLSGPPAASAVEVVDRLLAVQAQDARGARLAVRARSTGLHVSDVERALDNRDLVVSWLNRGTLHLVRAEDYPWLHALTTPPLFTGNATRLRQEGVTPEAADLGVRVVHDAVAADGPLTRGELRDRLDAAGVRTTGQALVHVLMLATLRGHIVRGPMKGSEQAFAYVPDWLGAPPEIERDRALAELARRYLRGHGPASDRDLARWAGVPLRDARAALTAIAAELADRDDGLAQLAKQPTAPEATPPTKLLGAFEPLLLGWTSRDDVLSVEAAQRLVTDNGLFRPFAFVGGRAAGIWSFTRGRVSPVEFFAPVSDVDDASLRADAADVERFLAPS